VCCSCFQGVLQCAVCIMLQCVAHIDTWQSTHTYHLICIVLQLCCMRGVCVLQHVAVCCSQRHLAQHTYLPFGVLQQYCSAFQHYCSVSQCVAICCSVLQQVAVCCSGVALCCSVMHSPSLTPLSISQISSTTCIRATRFACSSECA